MSATAVSILDAGLVTCVGLSGPATCAAIRTRIDNFAETRFMGGGEWIMGAEVPLDQPWRGQTKQVKMLATVLQECLGRHPEIKPEQIPILICVAEEDRPGRPLGSVDSFFSDLQAELGFTLHPETQWITEGRVGGALALFRARTLLYQNQSHPYVIVAGVDSYLVGPTLNSFLKRDRLLTAENSNGFIPGEAAGAVLLRRPEAEDVLQCTGMGFDTEIATVESEEPLRADGLVKAIKSALQEAGGRIEDMHYRITDLSGEQYGFKEAALALVRILRVHTDKGKIHIWHPADCIGEVGAAALPCMLGVALSAAKKDYAPGGNVLCHLGNDDGKRAAIVLQSQGRAN